MIAGFAVLSLLLPSASTRGVILLPVYEQALERIGAPSLSPLHRAVMLGLASLNRLGSNALLTGGVTPVVAAGLIGGFTWTTWLIYMGLPVYALLALGALAVYLMCRPTPSPTTLRPPPSIPADRSPCGPLSARERRTLLVAALVSVLWMLDWLHGWDPALPALLGAVLLVAPGPGSMSWRDLERGIGWSNLLLVGASLSLAQAMIRSGAAAWLADGLRLGAAPLVGRPIALAIGLVVGCLVLRALLPNITAYLTLLIPVAMQLAPDLGLNPLVCGMLVTIAGDSVLFYAAQSSSSFIVAERGHLLPAEVFRLAVIMSALVVVVLLAVALPYWALLGEPFT
jgi:di/tricarboxylate transporter